MPREITGNSNGSGRRIGVVVSRFNPEITERLLAGAIEALRQSGVADHDITLVRVPGAFEIPQTARALAANHDAVVCLGAVVRGDTDHYDHVATRAALGIGAVADETGVPVIFGVLTCDTAELALARAGGSKGDKGAEAAITALEMVSILQGITSGETGDAHA